MKENTCDVERRRRQSNWVCEGVEGSAVLQPDDPDGLRWAVGHAAQVQGHVGLHRHVLGLHREMWKT